MDKEDIKQLERMIEVVMRSIPKERQAHDIYSTVAQEAKTETARLLFDMLAEQEEEHEAKLRAALEVLKQELDVAKGKLKVTDNKTQIYEEGISDKQIIKDMERVLEVVVRMIPKERSARDLYLSTAGWAKREMTKKLFETLADQEQQHEDKLRGVLEFFKKEMNKVKAGKAKK
jgi:rubrerythrin